MDGVEIVMEIEEAFDIQIEDKEAEQILTPRQLIELVMSKVERTASGTCLTQRSFNLLRRALLQTGPLKRADVSPSTKLDNVLPTGNRRRVLEQITQKLGISMSPRLVRSEELKAALIAVTVISSIAASSYLMKWSIPFMVSFISTAIITGYLGYTATKGLRNHFPKELNTVGAFARWVAGRKPDLADGLPIAWTREQIALRVREIVTHILACEAMYREDAHFIKDLGMS